MFAFLILMKKGRMVKLTKLKDTFDFVAIVIGGIDIL